MSLNVPKSLESLDEAGALEMKSLIDAVGFESRIQHLRSGNYAVWVTDGADSMPLLNRGMWTAWVDEWWDRHGCDWPTMEGPSLSSIVDDLESRE